MLGAQPVAMGCLGLTARWQAATATAIGSSVRRTHQPEESTQHPTGCRVTANLAVNNNARSIWWVCAHVAP